MAVKVIMTVVSESNPASSDVGENQSEPSKKYWEALLAAGEGNVSEVAYAVGFVSLAGFSRAYKRRFGVSPASHLRSS